MQNTVLYPPVYVLGNGQLGRMLRYAGAPLDIAVYPLDFDAPPIANLDANCVITAEIERWPQTPLTAQLSQHHHFINQSIFAKLADRLTQKALLDELQLPTAPWQLFTSPQQWETIFNTIGEKVVVKRRTGGYDGRGQWIINADTYAQLPEDTINDVIVEQFIPFEGEVSLVGARFKNGATYFYPVTHNLQQNGILRYSVMNVTLPLQSKFQQQAEKMLTQIMEKLNYVGVMAMECFVVNNQLLINELAPRVHNSGHWTQSGSFISQFELHLRALLDLPTPPLKINYPISVMVNLIGIAHNPQWLSVPFTQLHWYGKAVRSGRKVGHINLSHADPQILIDSLNQLKAYLNEDFYSGLEWTINKLNQIG